MTYEYGDGRDNGNSQGDGITFLDESGDGSNYEFYGDSHGNGYQFESLNSPFDRYGGGWGNGEGNRYGEDIFIFKI